MRYATIKIETWNELASCLSESESSGCLYRGQSDSSWRLVPDLYRGFLRRIQSARAKTGAGVELSALLILVRLPLIRDSHFGSMVRSFAQAVREIANEHGALPAKPPLDGSHYWTAFGRHYGLHVPALDWTSDWRVAAFFALKRARSDVERRAAVWVLKANLVSPRLLVIPQAPGLMREQAQSAVLVETIGEVFSDAGLSEKDELLCYSVSLSARESGLAKLESWGFSAATLFPDQPCELGQLLEQAAINANELGERTLDGLIDPQLSELDVLKRISIAEAHSPRILPALEDIG